MKSWLIFLILVAFLGAIVIYAAIADTYPVSVVNSRFVRASDLNNDLAVATNYYERMKALGTMAGGKITDQYPGKIEIERAVLDKLVEASLIDEELNRRISKEDLQGIIDKKVETAVSSSNIAQAALGKEVEALYGLQLNVFKKVVLVPQAKREILEGRMLLESKTKDSGFDGWLEEAKSRATVFILIPDFSWDGGRVVIK